MNNTGDILLPYSFPSIAHIVVFICLLVNFFTFNRILFCSLFRHFFCISVSRDYINDSDVMVLGVRETDHFVLCKLLFRWTPGNVYMHSQVSSFKFLPAPTKCSSYSRYILVSNFL